MVGCRLYCLHCNTVTDNHKTICQPSLWMARSHHAHTVTGTQQATGRNSGTLRRTLTELGSPHSLYTHTLEVYTPKLQQQPSHRTHSLVLQSQ